jgi:hypothetical protein
MRTIIWLVYTATLLTLLSQNAYAAKDKPVIVNNTADNPVLVDIAASRKPFRVYEQTLDLNAAAGRAGFNIDLFTVPEDVFFVIETVSATVRFSPIPSSADPVDITDINARFREQGSTEVNGELVIPASSSKLPYDQIHGLPTVTTKAGAENVRVVLKPGTFISWGFTVAGDSDSRGIARITLFGYFVPAESASYAP